MDQPIFVRLCFFHTHYWYVQQWTCVIQTVRAAAKYNSKKTEYDGVGHLLGSIKNNDVKDEP